MISRLSSLLLPTICIITNTKALLVPSGSVSSNSEGILSSSSFSSSTGRFSNSSSATVSTTFSYSTSLTPSSWPSISSTSSTTSLSLATVSKHTPTSLPAFPASPLHPSQPTSSDASTSSSSSSLISPSSSFRSPSRPNHRLSSGIFPSAQSFISGTSGAPAATGKYHSPIPVHQHGASGGSPLSTNATTPAPYEWPSGVPRGTSINTITKVPPPIGYNAGGPIFGANETLPNNYASGVLSLSYGMGNCSMSPGFDGYNAKSCSCVNRIGKWYHDYATATITTTSCQASYNALIATSAQQLGCIPQTVTELAQPYTAPADCCDKCGIVGSAVRLLYWPEKTENPASASGAPVNYANVTAPPVAAAASSGLVSDGMTFVSPSVYLVYTSIKATASCVARVNSQIPLGPVHSLVTRAYAPQALSTAICQADNLGAGIAYCVSPVGQAPQEGECFQGVDLGWAPINYEELANPPPDSVIYERKRSCFPSQTGTMDVNFLKSIFLNPQLSFPSDVSDIDPMWKTWGGNTCTAVNLGVADPPSTLGQATALVSGVPTPHKGVDSSDCWHCLVGPGLHSSAADLVPTLSVPGPTAEPAIQGQLPASPNAQQTAAPLFQHIPNPGVSSHLPESNPIPPAQPNPANHVPVNDPIEASPQQAGEVPNNAGSKSDPAPAPTPSPLPTPAAITLQPQPSDPQQGVIPQNDPSLGQAINGAIANQPANVPAHPAAPIDSPSPTDTVPLVPAVPSVNVGGNPVFQHSNSNLVVAGSTILPGSAAQVAGHSVSNGVDSIVIDGRAQAIPPNQAPATALLPLPTVPQAPPFIDNQPIRKQQNGNLVVAGTITVPPGVQTNIAGQSISNGPSQVDVNGQAFAAVPVQTNAPLLTDGGIVHISNGNLQLGSQTFNPGAQVTLSGQVVNYPNPGQVVVDGTTHSLAAVSSAQPLVIAGQTLNRASNSGVVVDGSTIAPGGIATVSGHTYSLAGSSSIIEDSKTYSIPATTNAYVIRPNNPTSNEALLTDAMTLSNGLVVTPEAGIAPGANPSYRLPDGAEISAGGSAAIISGATYSALPSGSGFLVNGKTTLALPIVTAGATPTASAAVYTIGGQVFTANPTGFDIGSLTVAPGGSAVTISGTVVSLDRSDRLHIGSSTMDLSFEYPIPTNDVVSIGGKAITADPTGFVVDGITVTPGGSAVTVGGTVVSLDRQSHLKIGLSTMLLTSAPSIVATGTQLGVLETPTPAGTVDTPVTLPTKVEGAHSRGVSLMKSSMMFTNLIVTGVLSLMLNL